MNLSERTKNDLIIILSKFEKDTYNEDDIEKLLLILRAFFKGQGIVWELASFIAHPEARSTGIFQEEIDTNYAILKYQLVNSEKFEYNPSIEDENLKINLLKIKSHIFKALILGGIKNYPEKNLLSSLNLKRKDCLKILNETYIGVNGYHQLKEFKNIPIITQIFNLVFSFIQSKMILSEDKIISQFEYCFKQINISLNLKFNYHKFLKDNASQLLLCIICILHSRQFMLFDGNIGKCEIGLVKDDTQTSWALNLNANVEVELQKHISICWLIMSLRKNITQFIPGLENVSESEKRLALKYFNVIRNKEGKLVVGKKI
ncbi:MAG: hypothetical protein NTY07_15305 [Bacteroidia bacterium]|nr:hypothetical protein [Bacteroidia bacterium]